MNPTLKELSAEQGIDLGGANPRMKLSTWFKRNGLPSVGKMLLMERKLMTDTSEIKEGEFHPAADGAMAWLKGYMVQHTEDYLLHKEALYSSALDGNRLAEICVGTIERLVKGQSVSDRYLLGLAWTIMKLSNFKAMEETESMRIDTLGPSHERD